MVGGLLLVEAGRVELGLHFFVAEDAGGEHVATILLNGEVGGLLQGLTFALGLHVVGVIGGDGHADIVVLGLAVEVGPADDTTAVEEEEVTLASVAGRPAADGLGHGVDVGTQRVERVGEGDDEIQVFGNVRGGVEFSVTSVEGVHVEVGPVGSVAVESDFLHGVWVLFVFLVAKLSKKFGISKFILIFLVLLGRHKFANALELLGVFKADEPCVGVSVKEREEVAESVAVGVVPVLIDFVDDFATAFNDDSADSAVVTQVVSFFGVVEFSVHILFLFCYKDKHNNWNFQIYLQKIRCCWNPYRRGFSIA